MTLELESVDRLYLNGYVPTLQTPGQLLHFLVKHRGNAVASPALLGRLTEHWLAEVRRFAAEQEGRFGVVLIGVAQERTRAFRSYKGKRPQGPSFEYRRASAFVNAYYFYVHDRHFGPAFIM